MDGASMRVENFMISVNDRLFLKCLLDSKVKYWKARNSDFCFKEEERVLSVYINSEIFISIGGISRHVIS